MPRGNRYFFLVLEVEYFKNGAVIYFEHSALDEWVSKLKNKGVEFEQEPTGQRCLWREAILKDPFNNKIKLYWAGVIG
mgnify:CR=1 FL=1